MISEAYNWGGFCKHQKDPLNWSAIPRNKPLLLAPPSPVSAPVPLPPSPSMRLLKPSKPSLVSFFPSPTTQPGTLHLTQTAGPSSLLQAVPTSQPMLAASTEPGMEVSASWAPKRYVIVLSLKTSPLGSCPGLEDWEVTMRYL